MAIIELLKNTFRLAWRNFTTLFKKIFFWVFGSIGSALAFMNNIIDKNPWHNVIIFIVAGLILLLIIAFFRQLFILLWRKYILLKNEAVYGKAIVALSQGFAKIHALKKKSGRIDPIELVGILRLFCDLVKTIFEYKTKSSCAVTIQVFTSGYSRIEDLPQIIKVDTLVRDSDSIDKRETVSYKNVDHHIYNNTCYQRIINNFLRGKMEKLYFLSNDLPSLVDYDNSSFSARGVLSEEAKKNIKLKRKEWKLGYMSELVVALSPIHLEDVTEMPILGFICVDCELYGEDIFNDEYDVALLRGVSDGLYDLIKEYFFSDQQLESNK